MEVVAFSLLSAIIVQILCVISYICYKHFKSQPDPEQDAKPTPKILDRKKSHKDKNSNQKNKKKQTKIKPKPKDIAQSSDTESYSMVDQLAQAIMHDHVEVAKINTEAVNERPKVKKHQSVKAISQISKSKNSKRNSFDGANWESVTNRKHKTKIEVTQTSENVYKFTLDENGGIVETPLCEVHFPAESVRKPLTIRLETERYENTVDESGEKFLFTPVIRFSALGTSQLLRRFTLKINTMNIMGRGWNLGVFGQIETSDDGTNNWTSHGRTEYQFKKPIQIVHDTLTNFRCVITRSQNASVSRRLNVALYIAKTKMQDPDFHTVHICVYDQTSQSLNRVESSMQKHILKLQPKDCEVPFGCDLHFKIQPGQKFDPEEKEIFMRWSEMCKASVFVKLQLRLNKKVNEKAPNEGEFRTLVYLSILKQNGDFKSTQDEYFYFYWVAGNLFANRYKNSRVSDRKLSEKRDRTISETGSYITSTEQYSDSGKTNLDDLLTLGGSHGDGATSDFVVPTGKARRRKNKEMKKASLQEDAAVQEDTDKMKNTSAISSITSTSSDISELKVQSDPVVEVKTHPKASNGPQMGPQNQTPRKSEEIPPLKSVAKNPPKKVDFTPKSSTPSAPNKATTSSDQAKRPYQPNNLIKRENATKTTKSNEKSTNFVKNRNFQEKPNYRPRNPPQGGVERSKNPPQSGGNENKNPPHNFTAKRQFSNNYKQFQEKSQNPSQNDEKSPKSSPKKQAPKENGPSSPNKHVNNNKKVDKTQENFKDIDVNRRKNPENQQNDREQERKEERKQNQGIKSENQRNFHPNQRFNRNNYQRNRNFQQLSKNHLHNGVEAPLDIPRPIKAKEKPAVPHEPQKVSQTTPNPDKKSSSSQYRNSSDRNEERRENFRNSSDSRFPPQNQRNYRNPPRQFYSDRPFHRQNGGQRRNFTPRDRGHPETQNRGNPQRTPIKSSTWVNSNMDQESNPRTPKINSSPPKQPAPKSPPKEPKGNPREPRGDPKQLKGEAKEPNGDPREPRGNPKEPKGDPRKPKGNPREPRGEPKEPRGNPEEPKRNPKEEPRGNPKEPKATPNGYQDHPLDRGSSKELNGTTSWVKETSSGDWADMAPPPPTLGEIAPYGEPLKVQSKPAPKDRRERPLRKRSEINHH